MWCQNVLKTPIIYNNKPGIFASLQYLTNNNLNKNSVTLENPSRRLFVSEASTSTIGNIVDQWSRRFESEGIPQPLDSIKHIVAHVTGTRRNAIDISKIKNDSLNSRQMEKLESLCKCRLARMPLQYLIGEWDFRDITLKLVPPIFVPWKETEIFVDVILKRIPQLPSQPDTYEMIEIGCGSGCISLALAHGCKKIKGIAIDQNPHACDVTTINRNRLNLKDQITVINATLKRNSSVELLSGWNEAVDIDLNSKLFDLVISNPPYVPRPIHPKLLPEIRMHNDFTAFDGGDDGLKVVLPVLKYAANVLKPGGRLFMEVYISHPEYLKSFTKENPDLKFQFEQTYRDSCKDGYVVELLKTD